MTERSRCAASSKPAPISAEVTGMMSASNVESVAVKTPSAPSATTKNRILSGLGVQRPFAVAGRIADGLAQPRQR